MKTDERKSFRIRKPENFKSCFIVYDEDPKLIVCLTNTHFQLQQDLDINWEDIEAKEDGDDILITYTDY